MTTPPGTEHSALSTHSQTDYLIVGQGLAGSLVAFELQRRGRSFMVVDYEKQNASSRIAAGMFTPINGKRMLVSWMAEELLRSGAETYPALEKLLHESFYFQRNIYQLFGSVKEQNDMMMQLSQPAFMQYVRLNPPNEKNVSHTFGAFEVTHSGFVDTGALCHAVRSWLHEKNVLYSERFNHDALEQADQSWEYKGAGFKNVIFCEGAASPANPYFAYIPFKLCKGEILVVRVPGINTGKILKKGVYLVHLHDDLFKAGSTYEWNDLSETPGKAGLESITMRLGELLTVPYEVVDHLAGIRPTIHDRKPVLGMHPRFTNMFIFNGLGTRGVMQAPYFARHLLAHIEEGKPLIKEVDVRRFDQFFPSNG
jgi:glycine/D-amino acid oxidase-like deaminating enzyme